MDGEAVLLSCYVWVLVRQCFALSVCTQVGSSLLCMIICSVLPVLMSFSLSLSRRLGAELGKSVVYQETNGGKRTP